MSGTATIERIKRMNFAFFQAGEPVAFNIGERNDHGGATVTGIKIFKVGTFRDSRGEQQTWTPEHLEQMVFNFNMLRQTNVLPNVPWRIDHSFSVMNTVGYIEKLYVQNGFLLADVLFTRGDAVDGMANGTYRSRSLEVGVYETNDEAFYWPVVTGCAFVDIPAVEGLYEKAQPESRAVLFDRDTGSANTMFKINGKDVTPEEWVAAVTYAQTLLDLEAVPTSEHAAVVSERDKIKADLDTATAAIATHGKGQAMEFRVNGQPVADVVAVQNHITTLETFRTDTVKAGKSQYVRDLAQQGKLPATQIDSQIAFVEALSDEQFDQFKKSWDEAPASSLFANHGTGPANADGGSPVGAQDTPKSELETARDIVAMHRRSGMKEDAIKETASYKRMVELEAQAGK